MTFPSSRTISSRSNPWFKRFRKAFEHHDDEILIEGPKSIRDAQALGMEPIAIAGIVSEPNPAADLMFDSRLFSQLTDVVQPQGLIALFLRPAASLQDIFSVGNGVVVALDGIQDPGNVGTIVRLSVAFAASGVVMLPDCADPFSSKALRASTGAALLIPICETTCEVLLDNARQAGFDVYSAMASTPDSHVAPTGRAVIVFGSEGRGVSSVIAAQSRHLSIPISTRMESLNVAAAAAILLARSYEKRGTE